MTWVNSHLSGYFTAVLVALVVLVAPSVAGAKVVVVQTTIQAAVDQAEPGDTVQVPPGVYTGTAGDDQVVKVTKDDITIKGGPSAVIDAAGFEFGIKVGSDDPITPAGCPAIAVRNFKIQGLTIKNADDTGVKLVAVEGFTMTQGTYLDNEEYGPFPVCSRDGVISHNFASGHKDAAIYVGDDDNVVVRNNTVINSAIGIEIENSINCTVRNNIMNGNTAGMLVVVLPGLPMPFTDNVVITNNVITNNNLPNPGGGLVGLFLPTGTGILNVGGDNVRIRGNVISGNDSFGVAIIGNAFGILFGDPRIEPFVDGNVVRNNTITNNGNSPDPLRALTPGADIVFIPDVINPLTGLPLQADPDPTDNCFKNNAFGSDFPAGIVGLFPCGP